MKSSLLQVAMLVTTATLGPFAIALGQESTSAAPPNPMPAPSGSTPVNSAPTNAPPIASNSPGLTFSDVAQEFSGFPTGDVPCETCDQCSHGPWSWAPKWLGSGLYAGGEIVFVRPHAEGNQAFLLTQPVAETSNTVNSEVNFQYNHEATGRFWLGCQNCDGWGVRTRYWQFDHDAHRIDMEVPTDAEVSAQVGNFAAENFTAGINSDSGISGRTARASYGLALETIDLEVTKQFDFGPIQFFTAGGLRYVDMDQNAVFGVTGSLESLSVAHAHGFEGVGPTFNVEAWYPVAATNVTLYSQIRLSGILGETDQRAVEIQSVPNEDVTEFFQRDDLEEGLFITEFGLGLQYTIRQAFVNAGWEAQIWHGAGGPNSTAGDLVLDGFNIVVGRVY